MGCRGPDTPTRQERKALVGLNDGGRVRIMSTQIPTSVVRNCQDLLLLRRHLGYKRRDEIM